MIEESGSGPAPFLLEGGPAAVLLLHGLTGSPAEMRPLGLELHRRGLTVAGSLLPGHGTTTEDLEGVRWKDWQEHAEAALLELQARCETVFVGGLSLGSLLALSLAAHHSEVAGAITYSPALRLSDPRWRLVPWLKHVQRRVPKPPDQFFDERGRIHIWSYDVLPLTAAHELLRLTTEARRLLPRIRCPLLIVHSTADRVIHRNSVALLRDRVGSSAVEVVPLERSGHVVTLDGEWETVADRTYDFIARQAGRAR